MPAVEVLIPFHDTGDHPASNPRADAYWLTRTRLRLEHERWGELIAWLEHGDPWSKGAALATVTPTAPILIVHDADVWCDGLAEAVDAVRDGAAWAIPHRNVIRLTADGGIEETHEGLPGGGIVVLPRKTFTACSIDPQFVGWGGEDHAWGLALETLYGAPWRGEADLIHQWHPPAPRVSRRYGNRANEQLRQRYLMANGNPAAMRQLLEEAANVRPRGARGARAEVAAAG